MLDDVLYVALLTFTYSGDSVRNEPSAAIHVDDRRMVKMTKRLPRCASLMSLLINIASNPNLYRGMVETCRNSVMTEVIVTASMVQRTKLPPHTGKKKSAMIEIHTDPKMDMKKISTWGNKLIGYFVAIGSSEEAVWVNGLRGFFVMGVVSVRAVMLESLTFSLVIHATHPDFIHDILLPLYISPCVWINALRNVSDQ
jgi:hypothetical protein